MQPTPSIEVQCYRPDSCTLRHAAHCAAKHRSMHEKPTRRRTSGLMLSAGNESRLTSGRFITVPMIRAHAKCPHVKVEAIALLSSQLEGVATLGSVVHAPFPARGAHLDRQHHIAGEAHVLQVVAAVQQAVDADGALPVALLQVARHRQHCRAVVLPLPATASTPGLSIGKSLQPIS